MNNEFKLVYCNDDASKITNYLLNNDKYPFHNKRMRLMILSSTDQNLIDVLNEIFVVSNIFIYHNYLIMFYLDDFENLMDVINSISFELGIKLKINNGIYITKATPGNKIIQYIDYIIDYLNNTSLVYTDIISPIVKKDDEYLNYFKEEILPLVIKDALTKDIILTYFKLDLNVLKTSKMLYINRNSLIKKLDLIYKTTGVNLQKFEHASMIYLLMSDN